MALEPDTILYDLADQGRAVVVARLVAAGLESPGHTHVSAGQAALDDCCNGWLTVYPSGLYMSEPFPDEALFTRGRCSVHSRVVEFTFQYAMCVPTLDDGGHAPTDQALDNAGLEGATAMLAVHRGMACWVADLNDADREAFLVGRLEADEPSGGCVSWTGTVVVHVEDCACPA